METEQLHPAALSSAVCAAEDPRDAASHWRWRFGRWYFATWPIGIAALFPWSLKAAAAHFVTTHVLALYAMLRANSQFFGPVVQRFATREREVWLTIDDGPFACDTEAILEALQEHGVPATFFVEGRRIRENPALAQRIVAAGHSLGNHSQSHAVSRFWAAGPWTARRELGHCTEAIRETTGVEPVGFRPPVGLANGFVHMAAERLALPVIGWSARGYDGIDHNPDRVIARLLSRLSPGAILLLHQHPGTSGNAPMIRRLLTELRKRGYRCVLPEPSQFLHG